MATRYTCRELRERAKMYAEAQAGWFEEDDVEVEGHVHAAADAPGPAPFHLHDETGGVPVHPGDAEDLRPGRRVRIVGRVAVGNVPFGLYPPRGGRLAITPLGDPDG